MKIHRIVGTLTLSRSHPTYHGACLRVVEPVEVSTLNDNADPSAVAGNPDMLVVWDELGAGLGSYVAISDGGEAAQPFRPELKAVDAYCSAILDHLYIDSEALGKLKKPT